MTIRPPASAQFNAAVAHQRTLTKPEGSLGRLEEIACRLAAIQRTDRPTAAPARVLVCAGDHGVAVHGVSAFPQQVTAQMVANFASGGAAINVLADVTGADVEVLVLGLAHPLELPEAARVPVECVDIMPGTRDATHEAAMSQEGFSQAQAAAVAAVERAVADGVRVLALGEMGIANTTAASAITAALLERDPDEVTGRGTGVDDVARARKADVVRSILKRHADARTPGEILRCCGGLEMAAISAAAQAAAGAGIAVVADGFISTAAIACAAAEHPALRAYVFAAHRSVEPGHTALLEFLEAQPLLDLNLRLGEGSGAALALPLLRAACEIHTSMATFDRAAVSTRSER